MMYCCCWYHCWKTRLTEKGVYVMLMLMLKNLVAGCRYCSWPALLPLTLLRA